MESRPSAKETPTEINTRKIAELESALAADRQRVNEQISQLFGNEGSLKAGLDSAEFNLRVFQKVINDLVSGSLRMSAKTEQSAADEKPKLDWNSYYAEAEADMKEMMEAAKAAEKQKTLLRLKELVDDGGLAWLKERIFAQIEIQKDGESAAQQKLNAGRFFANVEANIARAKKDEPYDTQRLDQVIQMVAAMRKKEAERNGATHQDEPEPESLGRVSDEDCDHDEEGDTTVFGGDVQEEVQNAASQG